METNLYKVSKICWAVVSSKDEETQVFPTIDAATEHLLKIGVDDDNIDIALVDMLAKGTTRANFGVNGTFMFSDNTRLNENIGTA
jgi:hypothetical protein